MNCQECIRFLEAMPLRERTPAQMETLHAHGSQCPSCAQRLRTAAKVEHDLSQMTLLGPPADLSANVMRRLAAAHSAVPVPTTPRTGGLFWWVVGSMAALITIAIVINQAELMTWLKQWGISRMEPQCTHTVQHLLDLRAADPLRWVLVLAALIMGIAALAEREEPLTTHESHA